MTVTEKVAYLKGLAKGLDLAQDKAETKMFDAIMEVLEDMADVEEIVFDDYDDECDCCGDDDEMYEVECPACHETIYLDESILEDGAIECPNCGTELEFDFDCDCDDCAGSDGEDD